MKIDTIRKIERSSKTIPRGYIGHLTLHTSVHVILGGASRVIRVIRVIIQSLKIYKHMNWIGL